MNIKIIGLLTAFFLIFANHVFARVHSQENGLFKMDIPEGWHWVEYPEEIVVTYPDGKTAAIDIQLMPSIKLTPQGVKKALSASIDRMINEGINAHAGTLIGNKEIKIDGVDARELNFKINPQNPLQVRYLAFFNKGYAFTITYGANDEKTRLLMDDSIATLKLT